MSAPVFDPVQLLAVLDRHGVRFVVIGGFAAVAYGSPLPTSDIDITPARDAENLARLSEALSDLAARVRVAGIPGGLAFSHDSDSLGGVSVLNLVTRLGELDLVMDPAGEVPVPLAALDDVIASKEAAGRPKDHSALPLLHQLRRARDRGLGAPLLAAVDDPPDRGD